MSAPMTPEQRAEAHAEFAAWLVKKAREYRATGSRQHALQADAIASLASKVTRGAVRPDNLRTLPAQGGTEDETAGLLAEVERLRAEVAARPPEAHVLRRAAAALEEDDFLGAAAEVLEMANAAEQAASDRRWAAAEQGEMGGAS